MGIFDLIKTGLKKTRESIVQEFQNILGGGIVTEETLDELEEALIRADVGVETVFLLVDTLRARVLGQSVGARKALDLLSEAASELLPKPKEIPYAHPVHVILIVGVNGAGKTTTIGKLAYRLRTEGRKVMVAAGDTFRAAAIEQLEEWVRRAGVEMVKHKEGADAAAVAYDAYNAAIARGCDTLIIDTAGRLHNKQHLMDELRKIQRILKEKLDVSAPHESLLVIDGTTGQNTVNQTRSFHNDIPLTSLVITKLDGSAKGGAAIAIAHELALPIKWLGMGEKMENLVPFSSEEYLKGLFGDVLQ